MSSNVFKCDTVPLKRYTEKCHSDKIVPVKHCCNVLPHYRVSCYMFRESVMLWRSLNVN